MIDTFSSSLSIYTFIPMPFEFITYLIAAIIFEKGKPKFKRFFLHIGLFYVLKITGMYIWSHWFDYIYQVDPVLGDKLQRIAMMINPLNIVIWLLVLFIFVKNHKKEKNIITNRSTVDKAIVILAIIFFCFSFVPWAVAAMGI